MKKLAVAALLCAAALPLAAQTKGLVVKSRVATNLPGGGPMELPNFCDDQGRLYVKLVKPGTAMEGPLLRLSAKGVLEVEFDTAGAITNVFAVRPNGGVAMVRSDGSVKVVENFGPDGKRESSVRLEKPPKPFFPRQIAVFRSGEMLVAGVQYHPGFKASTAIYDATGHLVKQFELDGDAEIERAIEVGDARYTRSPGLGNRPAERSVAITGDDGFVYLMRATSPTIVYVISAAGEVVRKIAASASADDGLPDMALRVAKNRLTVELSRGCDDPLYPRSCQSKVYTVLDATTGKRLADYQTDKETDGTMACYAPDPDRFFTFGLAPDQEHLAIVEAAAK
jgi:hypothetical protein